MASFAEDLRAVFRALAEARDGDFYRLYVDLTYAWPRPIPMIEFRVFQVADSVDALVALGVDGHRPDGSLVRWGVSLRASPQRLTIHGTVEITDDSGVFEVFKLAGDPADAAEAAELTRRYAAEVCAQRGWMEASGGATES